MPVAANRTPTSQQTPTGLTGRCLTLCLWFFTGTVAAQGMPPARVAMGTVTERELAPASEIVGIIDFDRVSNVSSELSGLIAHQHIEEGALVEQDSVLVELNTDFIRKDMDIKNKEREQLSTDLSKLKKNLQRQEQLASKNLASARARDDLHFDHQALLKKREKLDEEIARLRLQLDKSRIRAPFTGVVLEKFKERGEWINPEMAVARVASTEAVMVRVPVPEKLVRFQVLGQPVPVSIPALDLQLEGSLHAVVPVADMRSKTVQFKVYIPYLPGMVRNMSARAAMPSGEKLRLRLIDRDAVVQSGNRHFVYTVEDGKARQIPVSIVSRLGGYVAVDDPAIQGGMAIVIDGNDRLQPGQPVQVIDTAHGG